MFTESLLLALAGGILGVGVAWAGLKGVGAILATAPRGTIPEEAVIEIQVPALVFAFGISALTALVFGLVPALETCKTAQVEL